jgi:Zn-dependent protease
LDTPRATTPAAPHLAGPNLAGPALVLGWLALGVLLSRASEYVGLLTFAFVMTGWVVAVAVHEFGHAFTAWLAGDHTVREKGYLTFDPRRYTDLGVSVVIPLIALALGGIGFPGGAVYLREDLMRSPLWRSAASLAGPAGTLLVLVALALSMGAVASSPALFDALAFLAFLQATALVLNLLPIPGFDGYGVIRPFLPERVRDALSPLEGVAIFAFLAVLFLVPPVAGLLFGSAFLIGGLLGVPFEAVQQGWSTFRFWS